MAAITCFVGLHFGHIVVHFKVWYLLPLQVHALEVNYVYYCNYVLFSDMYLDDADDLNIFSYWLLLLLLF